MARANEMHNALVEMAAENEEGLMENISKKEIFLKKNWHKVWPIGLAKHDFFQHL